jgi:hypothetical protein
MRPIRALSFATAWVVSTGAAAAAAPPGDLDASLGGAGWVTYVWKTDKGWSGRCGTFTLKLDDDSVYTADFQFK